MFNEDDNQEVNFNRHQKEDVFADFRFDYSGFFGISKNLRAKCNEFGGHAEHGLTGYRRLGDVMLFFSFFLFIH